MSSGNSLETSVGKSFAFRSDIWALALLNGANLFGFMAYYKVQPKVLTLFEFSDLALLLAAVQAFIGLIMNPLMGYIADRHRTLTNKAFNLVGIGVNFAGIIFMVVALGTTASANPTIHSILQPLVPFLVVLWLVAMAIFNSPAMSLVTAFAPPEKTMQAYISFAMIDILLYAVSPFAERLVDALPLGLVFFLGGLLLWGAYRLLRKMVPTLPPAPAGQRSPNLAPNLLLLFFVGFLITLTSKLPLAAVPLLLAPGFAQLGITNMPIVWLFIFGLSVYFAIFFGNRLSKSSIPALVGTLVASIALPFVVYALPNAPVAILAALVLSACTALLKLNSIPFVFTRIKPVNGGLGIGVYFAGVSLATLLIFWVLMEHGGALEKLLVEFE